MDATCVLCFAFVLGYCCDGWNLEWWCGLSGWVLVFCCWVSVGCGEGACWWCCGVVC